MRIPNIKEFIKSNYKLILKKSTQNNIYLGLPGLTKALAPNGAVVFAATGFLPQPSVHLVQPWHWQLEPRLMASVNR